MSKINIKVKGMRCKSCERLVSETLQEKKGVRRVDVSYKTGIVTIEFDDEFIRESEINDLKDLIKSKGYDVE